MFENRIDAGKQLAARLGALDPEQSVILALPRGGVPVAAEIARATGAPLDLIFVRKIGAPGQPELAIGAIVDGDKPQVYINAEIAGFFGFGEDRIKALAQPLLVEIDRRRSAYLSGRSPIPLAGKIVYVVDDGIATGASIKAALDSIADRAPARIVVALPVAPEQSIAELADRADEIVCLETPDPFIAVGNHYRDFDQVTDAEVIEIIESLPGGAD